MNQFFWNAYKRLEKEVLALSESIHFSDDQSIVYSSKIGDLLVRTAIEVESLSKVLYFDNGGTKPTDRDLYFDTDCIKLLEDKWLLSKKTIYVNSPYFYYAEDSNITLHPLYKAYKRGTSSSKWQQAYQAVKHDRINNLKKGNVGNLLQALGALYILNIYYRDAKFDTVTDKDASNVDWGLGSEIFYVKVSHESGGASNDKIYVKKPDYDECIYIVKHTDETARAYITVMQDINNQIVEEIQNSTLEYFQGKANIENIDVNNEDFQTRLKTIVKEKQKEAMVSVSQKNVQRILKAVQGLKYEAILNKQQY